MRPRSGTCCNNARLLLIKGENPAKRNARMPDSDSPSPRFATTRWTVVLAARRAGTPDGGAALEALCRAYWFPLYAYVRRTGKGPHDAQDLTQAFFQKLLEKSWLDAASRERGRFRTFLLVALKRFLANARDAACAAKRGGGVAFVSLEAAPEAESRYLAESAREADADALYERRWALALLDRAMMRLREDYRASGREGDFETLKVWLTAGRGEVPYTQVARDLGVAEGAARVAVHRLRKRFRDLFREGVAETVAEPGEVDAELRHVATILGRV